MVDTFDKAKIQKRIAAEKPKQVDSLNFLFENPEATASILAYITSSANSDYQKHIPAVNPNRLKVRFSVM